MSKRKRDDTDTEEKEEELKGLVVHTSLDTHMFIFVSPSLACSLLKERIVMEHSKFFPDLGKINITALKVKGKDGIYCHLSLPKNMQLRNALQSLEDWYFFADVAKVANHDSYYKKTKHKCVLEKLDLPRPSNDDQELVDSRQEVSAQPVLTNVAEETKVDEPKASKRKIKKRKQSERTSEAVAHIINDNVEPAGSKKPEEDNERSSVVSKKTSKSKEMPPTKNVPMTVQAGEGEHDNLNEISAQIISADETDMRNLEKKPPKKSNRKKVDQPSNDDTSSKLKPLEKDYQGNDHEAQQLKEIDVQDNDCEVNEENVNENPKMKPQTKHSVSENIIPVKKQPLAVTQRIMTDDNMRENETNDAASPSQLCNDKLNDVVTTEGDKPKANKQKTKKNEENDIISQVVAVIMTDYPEEVKQPSSSGKPLENNEDASINPKKKSKRKQIKPVIDLPEQVDDGLMANKNQKEEGNLENEQLNEISVGKVSSVKANTRNLEKHIISQVVAEIMTDYPEEVKKPSSSGKPLENNEDASINPKKKSKRKQIKPVIDLPEQVDDGLMANKNQKEEGNLENEQLNEISVGKVSSVKENTRNLEKQTTSKSKRKKVDQPTTFVDTSSNVMSKKNVSESERESVEEVMQPANSSKPLENNEDVSINLKKKPNSKQIKLVDDGLMTNKNQKEQGNLENEQLNEISVQKASSVKANTRNLEKTTSKSKRKKVIDQPSTPVDTSSNVMSMTKASEIERNSVQGHQVQVDDGLMTNKSQKEQGNLENELLNEVSVQKVPSVKANTKNLEKPQTTSKSKRKKVDQPTTSIDTSSNVMSMKNASGIEKNSVNGHELQIDAHKANEVDGNQKPKKKHKKHSEKNVSNTPMNQQLATTQKTVNDGSNQEESSNWSIEIENVDNQPASKVKAKKPNPSSSVDISSKAIKALSNDNVKDSENQQEVSLQEKPPTDSTKAKKPSARKLKAKKLDKSVKRNVNEAQNHKEVSLHDNQPASEVKGKKIDLSSSVDSERNVEVGNEPKNDVQEIDLSQNGSKTAQLNQIGQHKKHLDCQTANVKKSMQKKLTFPANGPSEVEQQTNGSVNVAKHKKGLSPLEEHNSEPTEIVSQEVPSTEIAKSGKPPSSKPIKNLESKEQNLNVTRNKGNTGNPSVEGSPLKQCITVKEHKKSHMENKKDVQKKIDQEQVFETPANKTKSVEPLSALPEKKHVTTTSGGLFDDISSDSSDDEVERNGSSSSTRTPDDLSSSDYSEGESKGDVVESQGGGSAKDKANTNLSGLEGLSLESVLRSSSRYKEAKLAASQSQLEDSEPPEFVPDSLAD